MERSHQTLLASAYTICLGLLATTLVLLFFKALGLGGVLPILPSILLAIVVAGFVGMLFNRTLLKQQSIKKSFLLGVLFLVISLPFYDLGALFLIKEQFQGTHVLQASLKDYFQLYCLILIYSFVFIGSWLSIFCGFSSIILNRMFRISS